HQGAQRQPESASSQPEEAAAGGRGRRGVATSAALIAETATGARRFRFPLVDRLVELEPGLRAAGVKLVAANEPYFDGHFPGAPVFTGVLLCEALAQLGAVAIGEGDDVALAGVQRARFRRPVLPGDVLDLTVQVTS